MGLAVFEWSRIAMKIRGILIILLSAFALFLTSCSCQNNATQETAPENSREPREISGDEALALYGVDQENGESAEPTSTPYYFFPAAAVILANENPLDPNETVTILPMFTRPGLNQDGTWLGDLEAGTEVVVHIINQDRTACLVEGLTAQGWNTKGWVACNRIEFTE